jgi:two-component system OmpR family sensor kinase
VSLVLLVAVALVVAAAAIYAAQSSYLNGRANQSAEAAAAPVAYALGVDARQLTVPKKDRHISAAAGGSVLPLGKGLLRTLPWGTFGELVGPDGVVLRGPIQASDDEHPPPRPAIPGRLLVAQSAGAPRLYTVPSTSSSRSKVRFRVVVIPLESGAGAVAVAIPLREVDQTLDRLVADEAIVVVALLVLLIGVGWVVIRVALRPLDEMSRVANEITEGDLSRRVSPATPRTEIGRLGLSLNRMLVRIEDAFAGRARSEERQRQFLADASHELRTPLASIRGYAELFRLGPARDSETLERAMARIESEAARMGVLVDDLLALARLDELPASGRVPVDIGELALQAVTDARGLAPGRSIALIDSESVEVLGDSDALRRALENLLGNALVHTPFGTPVEVAVQRDRGSVVIKVSDRGPGLPPGAEEQVFERFWRADGSRSGGDGGSGLGLAIVREIVRRHEGAVEAANRPDGGAVFTVRLPASSHHAADPEAGDRRPQPRAPAAS